MDGCDLARGPVLEMLLYGRPILGHHKAFGAETIDYLFRLVTVYLGKSRVDVLENVILNEVDADERLLREIPEFPFRFTERLYGLLFLGLPAARPRPAASHVPFGKTLFTPPF